MFTKLAKFQPLQFWRLVPGLRSMPPANDNRKHVSDHGAVPKRLRLVCRWFVIEGTNRLGCRWEVEGSDAPGRSLLGDLGFHETFFQLSYQRNSGRPARLSDPARPAGGLKDVLHARHSSMRSDDGAGGSCLQLRDAGGELRLSSMRLAGR